MNLKRIRSLLFASLLATAFLAVGIPASSQIQEVDSRSLIGRYTSPVVYNGYFYFLDMYGNHLVRYADSSLTNPDIQEIPPISVEFVVHGTVGFIRVLTGEVIILDMETPWPHNQLASLPYSDSVQDISTADTLLAVTLESQGYKLYSIADPTNIYQVASYDTLSPHNDEHYAYRSMDFFGEYLIAGRSIQQEEWGGSWYDATKEIFSFRLEADESLTPVDRLEAANSGIRVVDDFLIVPGSVDLTLVKLDSNCTFTPFWGGIYAGHNLVLHENHIYTDSNNYDLQVNVLSHYLIQENTVAGPVDTIHVPITMGRYSTVTGEWLVAGEKDLGLIERDVDTGTLGELTTFVRGNLTSHTITASEGTAFLVDTGYRLSRATFDANGFTSYETYYNAFVSNTSSTRDGLSLSGNTLVTRGVNETLLLWEVLPDTVELVRSIDGWYPYYFVQDEGLWARNTDGHITTYSTSTGETLWESALDDRIFGWEYKSNTLFVAMNQDTLKALDISDPGAPEVRAVSQVEDLSRLIAISEDHSLLVCVHGFREGSYVRVYTLAEDLTTTDAALIESPYFIEGVEFVAGSVLALAMNDPSSHDLAMVEFYDLHQPEAPEYIGCSLTDFTSAALASQGNLLLTLDYGELRLFDFWEYNDIPEVRTLELPDCFVFLSPFPNPFNASVTIPFFLPQSGDVGVRVYNLLGQEVWERQLGAMPSGWHRTVWDADGSGASSGVYILRLEADGKQEVRRVTLVR